MRFEELLRIVGGDPVFHTALLRAGEVRSKDLHRQLTRWVAAGKLEQLRRGTYCLAPPYRQVEPHPYLVANRLVRGSYVSGQSALGFVGLLPERVTAVTSVCSTRPVKLSTPCGRYLYQRIAQKRFGGYRLRAVAPGQEAFVALPEKALLDLVYLVPGGDGMAYLEQLRLQHLEQLDLALLERMAWTLDSPKLQRAARRIGELARAERRDYEPLHEEA